MNDPIEQLINNHPLTIQSVARELRNMIKKVMPEAHESIYHRALSYSLSESAYEPLACLALERNYIRKVDYGG